MNPNDVASKVGAVGKTAGAGRAGERLGSGEVAEAGQGDPPDLGCPEGDSEVLMVLRPLEDGVRTGVHVDP